MIRKLCVSCSANNGTVFFFSLYISLLLSLRVRNQIVNAANKISQIYLHSTVTNFICYWFETRCFKAIQQTVHTPNWQTKSKTLCADDSSLSTAAQCIEFVGNHSIRRQTYRETNALRMNLWRYVCRVLGLRCRTLSQVESTDLIDHLASKYIAWLPLMNYFCAVLMPWK